jgi:hypothetical protein
MRNEDGAREVNDSQSPPRKLKKKEPVNSDHQVLVTQAELCLSSLLQMGDPGRHQGMIVEEPSC